jgi:hypothetical protein
LAKKKNQPVVKRAPTAGERAKWQKQERRNNIVFVFGLVVIVAVLALIGYGYYDRVYQPDHRESNKLHKTVVQVNDKEFDLKYIIDVMRFLNTQQANSSSSSTSATATVKTYSLDETVQVIEYNELLAQASPGLGIAISEDDLQTKIKSLVYPNAPEDLTQDQYLKVYNAALKAQHVTSEEFRALVTGDLLRPKLQEYLKTQVPKSAEQVHLQGMLTDKSVVTQVADRLVFTSDSLAQVAQETQMASGSQVSGGDLSWLIKGILGDKFDNIVFNLDIGVLSPPIDDETGQSTNGVWLVSVIAKEADRALDDSQVSSFTSVSYSKWFTQKLQEGVDSKNVVNKLDDSMRTWATEYMAEHPLPTSSS